jgi:hypothetical protein
MSQLAICGNRIICLEQKQGNLDIGKSFEILQAAAEKANRINKKKLREMTATLFSP